MPAAILPPGAHWPPESEPAQFVEDTAPTRCFAPALKPSRQERPFECVGPQVRKLLPGTRAALNYGRAGCAGKIGAVKPASRTVARRGAPSPAQWMGPLRGRHRRDSRRGLRGCGALRSGEFWRIRRYPPAIGVPIRCPHFHIPQSPHQFVERWCGVVRGDWLTGQAAHSTRGTTRLILIATQQLTVHNFHSAPTVYD